jgi:hypothetical protein
MSESRLHHAYSRAFDTPRHASALIAADRPARDAAIKHLWGAILHHGTSFTAAAPAALQRRWDPPA